MDAVGRLILRFLLMLAGAVVAYMVAVSTLIAANRTAMVALASSAPQQESYFVFALPLLIFEIGMATALMISPAAIGALIAEGFGFRSWIYHALNGGLSMWVGWSVFRDLRSAYSFLDDPKLVVAAGIAAGFAYWIVAGWSAGFWKPVFRQPAQLLPVAKP